MRLIALVVILAVPGAASAASLLGDEPGLTPPAASTPLAHAGSLDSASPGLDFSTHFAKTAGLGVFASTAGVLIAVPLGALSNALLGQLPALLVQLVVGPALTALSAWLIGNHADPGRFGYWGAFGTTFLVHLATFVVTALALPIAVPWSNPVALLLYSLVDGLLMTGTSVGFMHLFPRRPPASVVSSFVPGVSDTTFVPLSTVSF